MEVPFVFPGIGATGRRYTILEDLVLAASGSIRSLAFAGDATELATGTSLANEPMVGAASASHVTLEGKNVLITTSALLRAPHELAVSMTFVNDPIHPPQLLYLDLGILRSSSKFATLAKVQAFSDDSTIRLILVDVCARILTLDLNGDMIPAAVHRKAALATLLCPEEYIKSSTVLSDISGSELMPNMVVFCNVELVLIAISPHILSVDMKNGRGAEWDEQAILKTNLSTLSKLWAFASDSGSGQDESANQMSPVAAMCFCPSENPLLDPFLIFTIHTDTTIRKWSLPVTLSIVPSDVARLQPDGLALPVNSLWSDSPNAVSMTARIYKNAYALAVHVQTSRSAHQTDECHFQVLSDLYYSAPNDNSYLKCLNMTVPEHASSLIGMSFLHDQPRCSIELLYKSVGENGVVDLVRTTYPPSQLEIVGTEPECTLVVGSLETVSAQEVLRIDALEYAFPDSPALTFEEEIHLMDRAYLKHLFRPIYPRGNGTVLPPSGAHVERALRALVPEFIPDPSATIELKALQGIHKWKNQASRRAFLSGTPGAGDFAPTGSNDAAHRVAQLKSHELRWRTLLHRVWEEEQVELFPLCCYWQSSARGGDRQHIVLIRSGTTTILYQPNVSEDTSKFKSLDDLALKMFAVVEMDYTVSLDLRRNEEQFVQMISSGELALPADLDNSIWKVASELSRAGGRVLMTHDDNNGIDEIRRVANTMTLVDFQTWLSSPIVGSILPETSVLANAGDYYFPPSCEYFENDQVRLGACVLSVRCADAIRKLQLGRSMLLYGLDSPSAHDAWRLSLRYYFHALACLYVSGQHVPMSPFASDISDRLSAGTDVSDGSESELERNPPVKKLSFGDKKTSILDPAKSNATLCLDSKLIEMSKRLPDNFVVSSTPLGGILRLCQEFVDHAFNSFHNSNVSSLPELQVLPMLQSRREDVPTDYPKLALRLVAVFVALRLETEGSNMDTTVLRNEILAECLLIESYSRQSVSTENIVPRSAIRRRACSLLVPDQEPLSVSRDAVGAAWQSLRTLRMTYATPAARARGNLLFFMSSVLGPGISRIEIARMCQLETVLGIFVPFASRPVEALSPEMMSSIEIIGHVFLKLSGILHRLQLLETHCSRPTGKNHAPEGSDILIAAIEAAIAAFEASLPPEIHNNMPEYANLWARLLNASIIGRQWDIARRACTHNPKVEDREITFKRLVDEMVRSGNLRSLIDMCGSLEMSSDECFDLYEIASNVLSETRSFDPLAASSPQAADYADYVGALFCLHVSQKKWRRAAEAMDLRHSLSVAALPIVENAKADIGSVALQEAQAMHDAVVSAVASLISLRLVVEPAHQFIVSGEHGPYVELPLDEMSGSAARKRKRNRRTWHNQHEDQTAGNDRLDAVLTCDDLQIRAVKVVSMKALFVDGYCDREYVKFSLVQDTGSLASDIDQLFTFGYFQEGILLANELARGSQVLSKSRCPHGQDILISYVKYIIKSQLLELASPGAENVQRSTRQRPQPSQLMGGLLFDKVQVIALDRSRSLSLNSRSLVTSASMTLLERVVNLFALFDGSLPVDTAGLFLCQSNSGDIPHWLYRLLMGLDVALGSNLRFAALATGDADRYRGNPSALLSLYTRFGFFAEACEVVVCCFSLIDDSNDASRLPEKGSIDMVPYKQIDTLWKLIELVLDRKYLGAKEAAKIKEARSRMKKSLVAYFERLKTSEAGLRSARALA